MDELARKLLTLMIALLIVCASLTFILCKYFYYKGMVKACENTNAYLVEGLKCMDKKEYQIRADFIANNQINLPSWSDP